MADEMKKQKFMLVNYFIKAAVITITTNVFSIK